MPAKLQHVLRYHRFGVGVDQRDPIDVHKDADVINPAAKWLGVEAKDPKTQRLSKTTSPPPRAAVFTPLAKMALVVVQFSGSVHHGSGGSIQDTHHPAPLKNDGCPKIAKIATWFDLAVLVRSVGARYSMSIARPGMFSRVERAGAASTTRPSSKRKRSACSGHCTMRAPQRMQPSGSRIFALCLRPVIQSTSRGQTCTHAVLERLTGASREALAALRADGVIK